MSPSPIGPQIPHLYLPLTPSLARLPLPGTALTSPPLPWKVAHRDPQRRLFALARAVTFGQEPTSDSEEGGGALGPRASPGRSPGGERRRAVLPSTHALALPHSHSRTARCPPPAPSCRKGLAAEGSGPAGTLVCFPTFCLLPPLPPPRHRPGRGFGLRPGVPHIPHPAGCLGSERGGRQPGREAGAARALGGLWARATPVQARGRRRERGPELRGPGLPRTGRRRQPDSRAGRRARGAGRDSAYLQRQGWACRPGGLQRAGAWPCHCPPPPEPPAARAGAGPGPDALPQSCGRQRAWRAGGAKSAQGEDPPQPVLPEPAGGVPVDARLSFPSRKLQVAQFTARAQEMTGPPGPSSVTAPPGLGALLPPRVADAAISRVLGSTQLSLTLCSAQPRNARI